eukprot:Nitzschia sp. Nitz4//scaffold5_size260463//124895//125292//NITZ4_000981-RA/size260463-processed-gene-0.382-mRNA-1//-1//CDS//3329555337//4113//frame0
MGSDDDYSTGHDMKSIAINIATTLVFLVPFVAYFNNPILVKFCLVAVVGLSIAYVVPPVGYRKPHPYSDDPNNLPYPRKTK